jgi:HK97 family phage prohead protease
MMNANYPTNGGLETFLRSGGVFRNLSQFQGPDAARRALKDNCTISTASPFLRFSAMKAECDGRIQHEANIGADTATLSALVLPYGRNSTSDSGVTERYQFGCFARSLASNADTHVMFNFDTKYVLARKSAGTARFWESPEGLRFECYPPSTTWADDLLLSVERRDITGTGIGCVPTAYKIEIGADGVRTKVITSADLIVVSVCSFARFDETLVVSQILAKNTQPPSVEAVEKYLNSIRGAKPPVTSQRAPRKQ